MRISDWSSDVCSSDLPVAAAPARRRVDDACIPVQGRRGAQGLVTSAWRPEKLAAEAAPAGTSLPGQGFRRSSSSTTKSGDHCWPPLEIGRAPCRERVLRYVWITVCAVSLTKKHVSIDRRYE